MGLEKGTFAEGFVVQMKQYIKSKHIPATMADAVHVDRLLRQHTSQDNHDVLREFLADKFQVAYLRASWNPEALDIVQRLWEDINATKQDIEVTNGNRKDSKDSQKSRPYTQRFKGKSRVLEAPYEAQSEESEIEEKVKELEIDSYERFAREAGLTKSKIVFGEGNQKDSYEESLERASLKIKSEESKVYFEAIKNFKKGKGIWRNAVTKLSRFVSRSKGLYSKGEEIC